MYGLAGEPDYLFTLDGTVCGILKGPEKLYRRLKGAKEVSGKKKCWTRSRIGRRTCRAALESLGDAEHAQEDQVVICQVELKVAH